MEIADPKEPLDYLGHLELKDLLENKDLLDHEDSLEFPVFLGLL